MRRAIKDRAALLVEIDWKKRNEEEQARKLETDQETRINEKQVRETKTNHLHVQAAREMLERLEREREARLQRVHSRRNGGRMPIVQPQDRAATEVMGQEHFAQRQRTHSNIPIRIARSIARVSIELSSAIAPMFENSRILLNTRVLLCKLLMVTDDVSPRLPVCL